ncbi:MAG: S41 family peptidase [Gammaproteobacteria bacterium]
MKLSNSFILSTSCGVVLGMMLSLSVNVYALTDTAPASPDALPLLEMKQFTHVLEQVKKDYVKAVDDKTLFENAMRGVLSGLDPHSAYLDQEDMRDLMVTTSGKFGGLGIEVTMEDGFVKVVSPIDDSPASKAKIQPGDLIVRINETPVKGLSLAEAVNMMRGNKGSPITLTIVREKLNKPLVLTLLRDLIQVASVKSDLIEPDYGYIRITHFQEHTGEDVRKAIASLEDKNKTPLKGVVLDLRNNPGGVLESSVDVADAFLDSNKLGYDHLVVYTDGRMASSKMREFAKGTDLLKGAPMVVLVNGGSASASEIVAGALQDHHRAIIMGSQTFGKGSVQTVIPLQKDTGLKLTTALYYTPSGRSIQAEGIKPDVTLVNYTLAEDANTAEMKALSLREQDLTGHLNNATNPAAETSDATTKATDKEAPVNADYGKTEALNLLKGLTILEKKG